MYGRACLFTAVLLVIGTIIPLSTEAGVTKTLVLEHYDATW